MLKTTLTPETGFLVKESVLLDLIVGGLFFFLFFLTIYIDNPLLDYQTKAFNKSILLVLLPAISFTVRGIRNKTYITINQSGIYYFGKLVSSWDNFKSAYITQDDIPGSIQDNFVLMVEHYKTGEDGYFIKKIPLTNTQNKSEEEVLAAVEFFCKQSTGK